MQNTENALDALKTELREIQSETEVKKRRTISKHFYVSEAEDRQIEELRQGVNFSAFVRAKILGSPYRPRPIVPQINREACVDLANLRSNCNQIARTINAAAKQGKSLPLTQDYLDQLQRIESRLDEISLQLSQAHTVNQEEME